MMALSKRKYRMQERVDFDTLEATSEKFRIEVDMAFQSFLADDSQMEYSFSSQLNNLERKYIHQKALRNNLMSRSHGKDPNRTLTIYKKQNKSNFESFFIDISPSSQKHLDNLFNHYDVYQARNYRKLDVDSKVTGRFVLGLPPPVVPANLTPQMAEFQKKLPIFEMKHKIVQTIRENKVVIISSETGSGKTTQIPQYILDDCLARRENCRVLCTQPRRISAVSVAERVADERGSQVGDVVGYQVRLETRLSHNSNLIYCTNGVLIRNLMLGDGVLNTLTHIIIDEVHERDKLSDFLLICLRESLKKGIKIKLILMSATINIDKFYTYFGQAEILQIPGRLFSIAEVFLDEILKFTEYKIKAKKPLFENAGAIVYPQNVFYDEIIEFCRNSVESDNEQAWDQLLQYLLNDNMPVNYQESKGGLSPLMVAVQQENIIMVERLFNLGADPTLKDHMGYTAIDIAQCVGNDEIFLLLNINPSSISPPSIDLLSQYYKTTLDEDIDFDLITKLISIIHKDGPSGGILVFLPGYDDIMICNDRIEESIMDRGSYRVFFLHGSMNIKEQHEVFKPLPHKRKIILSTNIAETSLTIDDIMFVIDCGKAKVLTYDSCSGLSSLQTQWISKACVKQRAGRAGRTQNGIAFHMFSQTRYNSFLDERIPEILRVPLEELCLNTKTLARNFRIYDFLVKAPDPPSPNTVRTAIENLECLGALDSDENLTPLGEYLSQLTIEPHLGKMLIYSTIFKCLDPILTIVASMAQKDPFQLPPQANLRTAAAERRRNLSQMSLSDHFIYLTVFRKWQEAVVNKTEWKFSKEYFISLSIMDTILKTRSQLMRQLKETRFVQHQDNAMQDVNVFSENWPLIKAVIAAGLYPKLSFKKGGNFCTRTEKKVLVHNSSSLSKETVPLWLVYDELVKVRNGNQIRGVTPITPITITLMCGIKTTVPLENHMDVDDWLEFEFPNTKIIRLRKLIDNLITKKLSSPINSINSNDLAIVETLANVLNCEELAVNMNLPPMVKYRPKFFECNKIHGGRSTVQEILQDSFFSKNINLFEQNNTSSNVNGASSIWRMNSPNTATNNLPVCKGLNDTQNTGAVKKQFYPKRNNHNKCNMQKDNFTSFNTHQTHNDVVGSSFSNNFHSKWNQSTNIDLNYYYHGNSPSSSASSSSSYTNFSLAPYRSNMIEQSTNDFSQQWKEKTDTSHNFNISNCIFYLIKAKKETNIFIAYENSTWVFAASTEKKVFAKSNEGLDVLLVYVVPEMNCFYGIAKFLVLDRTKGRPKARIEWIIKQNLAYKDIRHLRNPLNDNKLIFDAQDGQEIEISVAKQLLEQFSTGVPIKHGRPIRNKNFSH